MGCVFLFSYYLFFCAGRHSSPNPAPINGCCVEKCTHEGTPIQTPHHVGVDLMVFSGVCGSIL